MVNLIAACRTSRRNAAKLKELDDRRADCLKRIADALADLSDGLGEMGLPAPTPRQVADAAEAMRNIVLDFTDRHETDLALAQSRADVEIETVCDDRRLDEWRVRNSLAVADHHRDLVRGYIKLERKYEAQDLGDAMPGIRSHLRQYRIAMAEAFRPVSGRAHPIFQRIFDAFIPQAAE